MFEEAVSSQTNDDPRKLSALIARVSDLARDHGISSVVAGLAAEEGDLAFPEYVHFLQSALRVEDGIFRMTRERAVVHLADVDPKRAEEVLDRLAGDFCDEFPAMRRPTYQLRMVEVKPEGGEVRVKDVLTRVFAARTIH
jgi:hypothetical protein